MLRVALLEIALFLLPFIAFGLYLWLRDGAFAPRAMLEGPLLWLAAGGLVIAAIGLFMLANTGGAPPGGVYVPPRYEDGVVIPGHVEPRQEPRGESQR